MISSTPVHAVHATALDTAVTIKDDPAPNGEKKERPCPNGGIEPEQTPQRPSTSVHATVGTPSHARVKLLCSTKKFWYTINDELVPLVPTPSRSDRNTPISGEGALRDDNKDAESDELCTVTPNCGHEPLLHVMEPVDVAHRASENTCRRSATTCEGREIAHARRTQGLECTRHDQKDE